MAEEIVEGGRLYFPPEDPNNPDERKVLHPETNSDQVIMKNGQRLSDALKGGLIFSEDKPGDACTWGHIKKIKTI